MEINAKAQNRNLMMEKLKSKIKANKIHVEPVDTSEMEEEDMTHAEMIERGHTRNKLTIDKPLGLKFIIAKTKDGIVGGSSNDINLTDNDEILFKSDSESKAKEFLKNYSESSEKPSHIITIKLYGEISKKKLGELSDELYVTTDEDRDGSSWCDKVEIKVD